MRIFPLWSNMNTAEAAIPCSCWYRRKIRTAYLQYCVASACSLTRAWHSLENFGFSLICSSTRNRRTEYLILSLISFIYCSHNCLPWYELNKRHRVLLLYLLCSRWTRPSYVPNILSRPDCNSTWVSRGIFKGKWHTRMTCSIIFTNIW